MNIGDKMIDTDMFLNIVEKHHHKGGLHSDDLKNFCLVGAAFVASGEFDFEKGQVAASASFDGNRLIKSLVKVLNPDLEYTFDMHMNPDYVEIPIFNDDEATSHEDIMLVAKKAVAEMNFGGRS